MRQNYKLKINEPCSENWHEMTDIEKGKFCSSCAKPVIDFTNYSNSELIDTFKNTDKKICGKLYSHQLDTPLVNNYKKRHSSFIYKILSASILVGFSKVSFSQKQATPITEVYRTQDTLITIKPNSELSKTRIIKGCIMNENNDSIPFVNLEIQNSSLSTVTNLDGLFELLIPDSIINKKITLKIYSIGYETIYHVIEPTFEKSGVIKVNFKLKEKNCTIGTIVIHKKKKWWQRKRRY